MTTTIKKGLFKLREYQVEAINAFFDSYENGENSGLLHLATGLGKTVIASELVSQFNKKTLFIVHREELAQQTLKKMLAVNPNLLGAIGIVKADFNELGRKITIAGIQTLCSEKRLKQVLDNGDYELIVVDECHHYTAGKWKEVLDKFNGYKLGLTATPNRSDRVSINSVFDKILYRYSIIEGIKNGYLTDIKSIRYKINVNMDEINISKGDYQISSLSGILTTPELIKETYSAWEKYAQDRKTILFGISLEHVQQLYDYFKFKGVSCAFIIGDTDKLERNRIYKEFEQGNIKVLISCMVLTEGFDEPSADCVLVARPTLSESLYIQMVGRGLRLFPNKENCLIIDLVGNSSKHRLMQLGILFGVDPEKKEKAVKQAKQHGIDPDHLTENWDEIDSVLEVLGVGKETKTINIEDKRKFHWVQTKYGLTLNLGKKAGLLLIRSEEGINFHEIVHYYNYKYMDKQEILADSLPLDWAITISEKEAERFLFDGNTTLIDKTAPWRSTEISEKQINLLRNLGFTGELPKTKGEASELTSVIFAEQRIEGCILAKDNEEGKQLIHLLSDLDSKGELNCKKGNKKFENMTLNELKRLKYYHDINS